MAARQFCRAKKFDGPRPGMAFKLGHEGVGYYPDHGCLADEQLLQQGRAFNVSPVVLVLDSLVRSSGSSGGATAAATVVTPAAAVDGFKAARDSIGGRGAGAGRHCAAACELEAQALVLVWGDLHAYKVVDLASCGLGQVGHAFAEEFGFSCWHVVALNMADDTSI